MYKGHHGSCKLIIILSIVFTQAVMICLIVNITLTWTNQSQCPDVFRRPHEKHKIKITPKTRAFPFQELENDDFKKLIDLSNFTYTIPNDNSCLKSTNVFLLLLVPSAASNEEKRDSIRDTWGSKMEGVKILFMLGLSGNPRIEESVQKESKRFGDIVQGNFIDSYGNITYKSVMSFKYVVYHCPQATYILKIDDDSFANVPLLLNFLKHDLSPYGAENLFLCNDMTNSPVLRNPKSKWYVPKEDYADAFYPSYCSGWYVILSPDVCFKLYRESQKLKYLFIEDAFVYGIAAKNANLTHSDISRYTLTHRSLDLFLNGTYGELNILFGKPNMSPKWIRTFYEYFKNKSVVESLGEVFS